MTSYPILVERYDTAHPADLAICEDCDSTFEWDPEEGDPYDQCVKCPCGGQIVFKYLWADKCKGCGALGFYKKPLGYCCSRRCMLQAEYADSLRARA